MNKIFSVYILQSEKDNKFYIGCTGMTIENRLEFHNSGYVISTKHRRPFKIVYSESFNNKHDAFKREWHLKHPVGYKEKLEIINKYLNMGL